MIRAYTILSRSGALLARMSTMAGIGQLIASLGLPGLPSGPGLPASAVMSPPALSAPVDESDVEHVPTSPAGYDDDDGRRSAEAEAASSRVRSRSYIGMVVKKLPFRNSVCAYLCIHKSLLAVCNQNRAYLLVMHMG